MLQRCTALLARGSALRTRISTAPSSALLSRQTQLLPIRYQRCFSASPRIRSTDIEPKPTEEGAATNDAPPPSSTEKQEKQELQDPLAAELEARKREVVDLTDKWKRSIADYRNLQNQTKREVQKAKDFALERFTRDLIDSVDNLDRALGTVPEEALTAENKNKDLENLYQGLKMTESILMQTLKKHGLERFDPAAEEEKFDPNRHEATFQAPQKDKEDGTVFVCQQKGFALNGRVLRAAKVGVVKNS